MIYIKSFKNYEEFKTLFGIQEHGNGVKSRKNKILLSCLKDRKLLKWWLGFRDNLNQDDVNKVDYLKASNMDKLKKFAKFMLTACTLADNASNGRPFIRVLAFESEFGYRLYSPTLKLDNYSGLCADGDVEKIRYVNTERDFRVSKMKAGKFISKCIEDNFVTREYMPEQMKRWIGEEFAREWQSYASQRLSKDSFVLHVDYNFSDIYDSYKCDGDFGSCMTDKDFHSFYSNSVDCMAAYLTNVDGLIVARCVIFEDVRDEEGNHYRLAERQYSSSHSDVLKQILIDRLIEADEIDGYKVIGATCSDNHSFVTNDGRSLDDKILFISCDLESFSVVSYQDSFVYYDNDTLRAYNDDRCDFSDELNTTDGHRERTVWSRWNNEYIPVEDSVYDEPYDDYIYEYQGADAIINGTHVTICDNRASGDSDFEWSSDKGAYLMAEDACYIESEGDYFPKDECVCDYSGDWQLKANCIWSPYYDDYILEADAVYSAVVDSNILESEAYRCPVCAAWRPDDYEDDVYSELTEEYYDCEECKEKAEKEYKERHALTTVA